MKRLACFPLLLLLTGVVALAQTIPTCNSFNGTGVPIYSTAVPPNTVGTTLCTDFFGVANWANSPLPAGPLDITATGFTILNGGSNYSATPTVTITDFYATPGASGAACSATVTTGVITAITCSSAGAGYVAPVVTITDTTGTGAMVLAKLSSAGPVVGGIRKFLDPLPDLKTTVAVPNTTLFPGSDYYEIALVQYTTQMHSDLPPTTVRGYVQVPAGSSSCPVAPAPQYMGPVIMAKKNVPVRLKFSNCLPGGTAGNLFIPVDTTFMGAGLGPDGTPFLQNRSTVHLHGGDNPWISDGTPHQWTVPAADWSATTHKRGASAQMVPDMYFVNGVVVPQCSATVTNNCSGGTAAQLPLGAITDPGPGAETYYFPNQQSGRFMFYHDHAFGITRLNVYAGIAAGYLIEDPGEEPALKALTVPGTVSNAVNLADPANDLAHLVPLVIQDKTFVPNASQLAGTDPTWIWGTGTAANSNSAAYNGNLVNGDLWFSHVYTTNQDPADPSNANAFGRWDYGPWFFPPQTTLSAAGTGPLGPHTAVTVPCTSRAFPGQVLAPTSANNYQQGCPIIPNPSGTPESFMDTPVVNGKAYPVLNVEAAPYRLQILNAANDRMLNLSLYQACGSGTFSTAATNCTNPAATGKEVPMVPAVLGGPGTAGYVYPDELDGRLGGVPDSTAMGPSWVQIGNEGGLLPGVAIITPAPVGYEYNRRNIVVLNVSTKSLFMGPAERADVVVDFSAYAGKTLILYNDSPAPVPGFDPRIDYYSGDQDQVQQGGAPSTIPGYGPNTRTIMEIVVGATSPTTGSLNLATLQNGLPSVFQASQPVPIVPEPTYPVASGGNSSTATYASVSDNTITYTPIGGSATVTYSYDQKAIQELFTLDYGRMNATLGVELPLTNFLTQTTIPYGFADWPTEIIQDGTDATIPPQFWKITHNGVDSHPVHFHLFNVQVINRVGWDGMIRPPDANELGWKETVRMHPLEDIVVALRPVRPTLPFPLPDSIRSMDATMMDGMVSPDISGVDPTTGNALPGTTLATNGNPGSGPGVTNAPVNFGWEYVWHCHILGHEENDFMRTIIFQVAPPVPSILTAASSAGGTTLSWTDNSANETSFTLQRSTDSTFPAGSTTTFALLPPSSPNTAYGGTLSYLDTSASAGTQYYYRVRAEDDFSPYSPLPVPFQPAPMSSAWSNPAGYPVAGAPAAMTSPTPGTTLPGSTVTFTWTTGSGTISGYQLWIGTTLAGYDLYAGPLQTTTSATVNGLTPAGTIYVRLWTKIGGTSWLYNDYQYQSATPVAAAMTSPTPGTTLPSSTVTFTWTTGTGTIDGYQMWIGTTPAGYDLYAGPLQTTTSATVSGLTPSGTVYVRLWTKMGASWPYNDYQYQSATAATPAAITSPTPGTTLPSSTVTFSWSAGTGTIDGYQLWVGTTPAGYDLYAGPLQTTTSATVSGLTTTGTIYVRLWTKMGSSWPYNDYQYQSATAAIPAAITSPTPGSTLPGSTVTFTWTTGTGTINGYQLWIGTTPAGYDLYAGPLQTTTSATVNTLTATGTIYVRLWTKMGSSWLFNDYQYLK